MSLRSALYTALSGVSAAETTVRVIANNLANAQTAGFKASKPSFATQTPQTLSLGAAPSGTSGGTNPVQVGSGVRVAEITSDFSQGSLAPDSSPTSLAIQGAGLFILEGSQGELFYTRDGRFHTNSAGELVSADGRRVLGFGVDENFQIERTGLGALRIPRGMQVADENGQAATLRSVAIARDGRVRGKFTDGRWRDLGQIRLARFANPSGLERRAGNVYAAGVNSGPPVETNPGELGAGEIIAGMTELSNTDVAESLVDLSLASIQFLANLQVIATGEAMLDELMTLVRRE